MSFGEGNLHDENEWLMAEVDRLKAVNGKLCNEINRQERVIERQTERIAELERDNDEVLEMWANQAVTIKAQIDGLHARDKLIRDMHRVMWACRELDCSHRENDCFRVKGIGDGECWFEQRMRELGIEVD